MAVFNRIHLFIKERGISRYRFWQDTQLGRDTAYRLCNDPSSIPTGIVLDKICSTYKMQPGEFLEWRDDDIDEDLTANSPFPPSSRSSPQSPQASQCSSQTEALKLLRGSWANSEHKAS